MWLSTFFMHVCLAGYTCASSGAVFVVFSLYSAVLKRFNQPSLLSYVGGDNVAYIRLYVLVTTYHISTYYISGFTNKIYCTKCNSYS